MREVVAIVCGVALSWLLVLAWGAPAPVSPGLTAPSAVSALDREILAELRQLRVDLAVWQKPKPTPAVAVAAATPPPPAVVTIDSRGAVLTPAGQARYSYRDHAGREEPVPFAELSLLRAALALEAIARTGPTSPVAQATSPPSRAIRLSSSTPDIRPVLTGRWPPTP